MNRYWLLVLLSVVILFVMPAGAPAIEGFPGSTWGQLLWDVPKHSDPDRANLFLQGWARQGVNWTRFGDNLYLNTFLTVRYRWDTAGFDGNNSIGPGVGISIDMYNPKGIVVSWAAEYVLDRMFKTDRTVQRAYISMSWYGWWDLKKKP